VGFLSLLKYIPDLIALVKAIRKAIDEAETDRKVKDDLKAITEAFNAKDSNYLNHIFNDSLPDETK
jgi:hypothetical protein